MPDARLIQTVGMKLPLLNSSFVGNTGPTSWQGKATKRMELKAADAALKGSQHEIEWSGIIWWYLLKKWIWLLYITFTPDSFRTNHQMTANAYIADDC